MITVWKQFQSQGLNHINQTAWPELVEVTVRTTGSKPAAVTTPSETTCSSPAATSRMLAPRLTYPVAY